MGATFPNGIANFVTHRDLLDDVEAADINKIQDEIVAMQSALGAALAEIEDLEANVDELQDEDNADQQRDQTIIIKFNNIKTQIKYLWEGKNIYVGSSTTHNFKIKNTPAERPYPPTLVRLNKPAAGQDPMAMWNGTGFTLKKGGFWIMWGEVNYNLAKTGPNSNANFGTYEASISINGKDWTTGLDRQYPHVDKFWHNVVLHPIIFGWYAKGTKITLRSAQSSDLDQQVTTARLSVARLRGA